MGRIMQNEALPLHSSNFVERALKGFLDVRTAAAETSIEPATLRPAAAPAATAAAETILHEF